MLRFGMLVLGLLVGLSAETALAGGVFIPGNLTQTSPVSQNHRPGCYYKIHRANLQGGKTYTIDLKSGQFDPYLLVLSDSGQVLKRDDDGGGNRNARVVLYVPTSGAYDFMVTTFQANETGSYGLEYKVTASSISRP